MNLFKNLFSSKKTPKHKAEDETTKKTEQLALDDNFVHHFIKNEGKFLYCTSQEEINQNLANIFEENAWTTSLCFNSDLQKMLFVTGVKSVEKQTSLTPFFTTCENLIAKDGSLLFTSNQLKGITLSELPIHFIVFAKTSQIVSNNDDALMSIKNLYKKNIPSNISPIKHFNPNKKSNDIMNYSNTNSKNLYLLLLEDL